MLAASIIIITVYIVMGVLYWQLGYLGMAIFFVVFYWGPNKDVLRDKRAHGRQYEYQKEYNNLNPLYERGSYRKRKKGTQIFSSFKGLYICQIISLVLLFLTLIYYCVMNCYQRILWVEVILTACFVLLMLGWGGVKLYYSGCYEQRFRYTESPNGIWKPFSYIYQPRSTWKKYKPFWCHYYVGYDEMKENLQKSANEKKYVFVGCAEEDKVKEFNFFTRLDGENLDIFALIHVERLEEESWDIFNRIFETFWIQNIMNKFETKHMAFTFLLCVDEYSKELRKKRKGFYSVDSKTGRYRLSAILAYSEYACLDIPVDYRIYFGDKRRSKIRNELLELLGISWNYNGESYPKGYSEEDDF